MAAHLSVDAARPDAGVDVILKALAVLDVAEAARAEPEPELA